jgi:hypothetical protein
MAFTFRFDGPQDHLQFGNFDLDIVVGCIPCFDVIELDDEVGRVFRIGRRRRGSDVSVRLPCRTRIAPSVSSTFRNRERLIYTRSHRSFAEGGQSIVKLALNKRKPSASGTAAGEPD